MFKRFDAFDRIERPLPSLVERRDIARAGLRQHGVTSLIASEASGPHPRRCPRCPRCRRWSRLLVQGMHLGDHRCMADQLDGNRPVSRSPLESMRDRRKFAQTQRLGLQIECPRKLEARWRSAQSSDPHSIVVGRSSRSKSGQ